VPARHGRRPAGRRRCGASGCAGWRRRCGRLAGRRGRTAAAGRPGGTAGAVLAPRCTWMGHCSTCASCGVPASATATRRNWYRPSATSAPPFARSGIGPSIPGRARLTVPAPTFAWPDHWRRSAPCGPGPDRVRRQRTGGRGCRRRCPRCPPFPRLPPCLRPRRAGGIGEAHDKGARLRARCAGRGAERRQHGGVEFAVLPRWGDPVLRCSTMAPGEQERPHACPRHRARDAAPQLPLPDHGRLRFMSPIAFDKHCHVRVPVRTKKRRLCTARCHDLAQTMCG
jgi:hypothetical protein